MVVGVTCGLILTYLKCDVSPKEKLYKKKRKFIKFVVILKLLSHNHNLYKFYFSHDSVQVLLNVKFKCLIVVRHVLRFFVNVLYAIQILSACQSVFQYLFQVFEKNFLINIYIYICSNCRGVCFNPLPPPAPASSLIFHIFDKHDRFAD